MILLLTDLLSLTEAVCTHFFALLIRIVDPWRAVTPHSDHAKDREDTILRPFKIIPGGVHHWDENGLPDIEQEPIHIRKIHGEMIEFVLEWLKDWVPPKVVE